MECTGNSNQIIDVIKKIKKMDIDIITLTETKKKGPGIEEISDYIHIYSGMPKKELAKRGLSVFVKRKYKSNITNLKR